MGTATLFTQPCQKLDVGHAICFRTGNSRAGLTESVFPKLNNRWSFDYPQKRMTLITQDFVTAEGVTLPTLALTCRQFVPGPDDVLVEPYQAPDGEVILVKSPPFACVSTRWSPHQ